MNRPIFNGSSGSTPSENSENSLDEAVGLLVTDQLLSRTSVASCRDTVCRDFLRNVCKRGDNCRYRHPDPDEVQQLSVNNGHQEKYVFCHDFQNSSCQRGAACRFVHCTRAEEDAYRRTGQLSVYLMLDPSRTEVTYSAECSANRFFVNASKLDLTDDTPLCKDYQKGICTRGTKCKYRHLATKNSTEEPEVESKGFQEVGLETEHHSNYVTDSIDSNFISTTASDASTSKKRKASEMDSFDYYDTYSSTTQWPATQYSSHYQYLVEENHLLRCRLAEMRRQLVVAPTELVLDQSFGYRSCRYFAVPPSMVAVAPSSSIQAVSPSRRQSAATGCFVHPNHVLTSIGASVPVNINSASANAGIEGCSVFQRCHFQPQLQVSPHHPQSIEPSASIALMVPATLAVDVVGGSRMASVMTASARTLQIPAASSLNYFAHGSTIAGTDIMSAYGY